MDWSNRWAPQLLSILRIATALVYLDHGFQKLVNFPASAHQPPLLSLLGAAAIIEVVAGLLILVGLFTRPAAFIASGEMAVAYFYFHAPRGFFPVLNFGDAAVLLCFIFLYIAAAGPGPWSIDAMRHPARRSAYS